MYPLLLHDFLHDFMNVKSPQTCLFGGLKGQGFVDLTFSVETDNAIRPILRSVRLRQRRDESPQHDKSTICLRTGDVSFGLIN